jgi:hypothetical protein
VREAGDTSAIKTINTVAPKTRYTDKIYYPGKSYEFYIFATYVCCAL